MPNTVTTDINAIAGLIPAVEPIVLLIEAIIKAHQNATNGQFPTQQQVQNALPADTATLTTLWATWTAAHPAPVTITTVPPA